MLSGKNKVKNKKRDFDVTGRGKLAKNTFSQCQMTSLSKHFVLKYHNLSQQI